jgi:hypothetical protein
LKRSRTPRRPPDEIRLAIERFLTASKQPVLYEPGEAPFPVTMNHFALESRTSGLLLSLWDETRNLSRKVTEVVDASHRARLELEVERFGGRTGKVVLADLAATRNASMPKRGERLLHREAFRRSLHRQYTGWRVAELTSEAVLEHSLSPAYPRAWLRKGGQGIAALSAPDAAGAHGALTFGLIWLDYLRIREPGVTTHALSLFLPKGAETDTALRIRYLDPSQVACDLFVVTEEGYEDRVDPAAYNNLDTQVLPRQPFRELDAEGSTADRIERELRGIEGVETVDLHDRTISFRVRGIEIARRRNATTTGDEIVFGIETRRTAEASHGAEIRELARIVLEMRNASNPGSALYRRKPEGWLESMVRANLEVIGENLCPDPVYGQVPAMAGARPGGANGSRADRDVIDLLAIERSGRLAVIELKASEDIHLPVQALDYWIRVKWHLDRGDFMDHFPGLTVSRQSPRLMLVSPSLDVHPSNERVLSFFSEEVSVEQIGVNADWRRELRVMFRRSSRQGR